MEEVIDCRSEVGITLGLIDSILAISRILCTRDLLASVSITDALVDMATDADLDYLLRLGRQQAPMD